MYITNITDYDNLTEYYNNTLSKKDCSNNENIIEIEIPIITILPCGMSLLCLISLMLYTLIRKNKICFNK